MWKDLSTIFNTQYLSLVTSSNLGLDTGCTDWQAVKGFLSIQRDTALNQKNRPYSSLSKKIDPILHSPKSLEIHAM